jgi:hypothetical protein
MLGSKLAADIKRMQIANRAALDKDLSFIIATSASSFYTQNIGLVRLVGPRFCSCRGQHGLERAAVNCRCLVLASTALH